MTYLLLYHRKATKLWISTMCPVFLEVDRMAKASKKPAENPKSV